MIWERYETNLHFLPITLNMSEADTSKLNESDELDGADDVLASETLSKSKTVSIEATDQEEVILVKTAQNGDMEAYDKLVEIHRGKIFAMIQNMLYNQADAWDLTQEVFIKAWKALPKFESRAKFSTWLYRIAHNAVYDWMRKKKISSAGEFDDAILTDATVEPSARTTPRESVSPDKAMENSELALKIKDAMAKISPEHRQVITLREIEGYDYKEIAEIMESSLGTVMSRLFYARKKLQTLLQNER